MVKYLRNNIYTPAQGGFIPAGMTAYQPEIGFNYNPDSAKHLLEKAGYANGKGLPDLALSTTTDYVDLCEYIQHQLAEFGINISVDVLPASVHRELTARGELDFFRKSWLADYPDNENFMALFYSKNKSPNGPNYTHFESEAFDELYEAALRTSIPRERDSLFKKMDALVMSEAPVVPLYYDKVIRFVSRDVSGLDRNPMSVLDLRRVRISKN
jgi:peptide/nickel transport system substrate-binding protein